MTHGELDVTVATALAEATDIEATDVISDFADYVDPDALNRLFQGFPGENRRSETVAFAVAAFDVVVHSDGTVDIYR